MSNNNYQNINEFTRIILDSITDGVFTVNKNWKITSFNQAAEIITGITREEAIGQFCSDVFRASICESECALRYTMDSGKPLLNKTIYIVNSEGQQIPVTISTALLKDSNGNVIGGVETFRDLTVVNELLKKLEKSYSFEDIISKNKKMLKLFSILPQIAESDSTVLVEGESGTGKELVARVIHRLSKRKNSSWVAVNCSALPDTLLESELFGYKAGAFTDAKKDKKGRFAQAEGGSIFLDEIGDITPALQVRFLRVLQEKEYEPLGSTQSEKANVRIITATNKNLNQLVQENNFRQDLYYRINVIKIHIPPLRERKEDIPLLVRHFIANFNHLQNKNIADVSPQVMRILMNHDYPGNVRELENIIEHAFVLCRQNIIEQHDLPGDLIPHQPEKDITIHSISSMDELEANLILQTLEKNNWNRLATAAELGMHKSTLFRKINKLGIKLPEKDGRSNNIKL